MHVLPTVSLTGYQKILLAKIKNAPDSPLGGKRIPLNDEKLTFAKDSLIKLDIISVSEDGQLLNITDVGDVLMKEEGLIDETNELTELGKQYATGDIPDQETKRDNKTLNSFSAEKFHISFKDFLVLTERRRPQE